LFAEETIDKESPMVGNQQALNHGHVINVKGTRTVLGVLSKNPSATNREGCG
jgi:hypothetical protein